MCGCSRTLKIFGGFLCVVWSKVTKQAITLTNKFSVYIKIRDCVGRDIKPLRRHCLLDNIGTLQNNVKLEPNPAPATKDQSRL